VTNSVKNDVQVPIYLDTAADVDRFLGEIRGAPLIALDTEGASFHRFVDRIYLLQLSTRDRTAVIDPLPIGAPAALGQMLESPDVEVVFHDADYDLRLLEQDYGWRARSIFDTRIAAQLLGLRAFGLAALLERYFGLKLDKKHQRADWSMRPLTRDMLDYAALDTMYLARLRDELRQALESAGRWEWAREEFQRLEGTRWADEEPGQAFLRMKGARDLNRRELALLRELVAWRDGVAGDLDRATFRVLGNEALFEIVRARPATRDQVAAIKGMPRGVLEQRWQDIVAAVQRGLGVAESELPRFPRSARWDRDPTFDARVSALKTVRDAAATRLELDPGVLCSRDRLESVARMQPTDPSQITDIPGMRRWQVEVLGDGFIRALRHHAAGGEAPASAAPAAESPTRTTASSSNTGGAALADPTTDNSTDESPYRDG
jgi:ribonuclease D